MKQKERAETKRKRGIAKKLFRISELFSTPKTEEIVQPNRPEFRKKRRRSTLLRFHGPSGGNCHFPETACHPNRLLLTHPSFFLLLSSAVPHSTLPPLSIHFALGLLAVLTILYFYTLLSIIFRYLSLSDNGSKYGSSSRLLSSSLVYYHRSASSVPRQAPSLRNRNLAGNNCGRSKL